MLHGELTVKENLSFHALLRLPADYSREEVEACVLSALEPRARDDFK